MCVFTSCLKAFRDSTLRSAGHTSSNGGFTTSKCRKYLIGNSAIAHGAKCFLDVPMINVHSFQITFDNSFHL